MADVAGEAGAGVVAGREVDVGAVPVAAGEDGGESQLTTPIVATSSTASPALSPTTRLLLPDGGWGLATGAGGGGPQGVFDTR